MHCIALFNKRRILEIKKKLLLFPEDCFSTLCDVYDKFLNQNILKKEYLQFCQIFYSFEETLNLPKKLHSEVKHFEEFYDIDDDNDDQYSNEPELDVEELSSDPLNSCSMKIIWKIFQSGKLDTVFPILKQLYV